MSKISRQPLGAERSARSRPAHGCARGWRRGGGGASAGRRPRPRPARRRRWREARGACGIGASARRSRAERDRPEARACARRLSRLLGQQVIVCPRRRGLQVGDHLGLDQRILEREVADVQRAQQAEHTRWSSSSASTTRPGISVPCRMPRSGPAPPAGGDSRPVGEVGGFSMQSCHACGTVFTARLPTAAESTDYALLPRRQLGGAAVRPSAPRRAGLPFDADRRLNRWLDVGCGAGTLMQAVRGRGWTTGTEVAERAAEEMRAQGVRGQKR